MTFLAAASAALSVAGAVTQIAQTRSAEQFNVELQEREQRQAVRSQVEQERQLREKYLRSIGTARARQGASGVRIDEGSPLLAVQEIFENMFQDVANLREGANLAVASAELQKTNIRSRSTAQQLRTVFNTGSSLLSSPFMRPTSTTTGAAITTGRSSSSSFAARSGFFSQPGVV